MLDEKCAKAFLGSVTGYNRRYRGGNWIQPLTAHGYGDFANHELRAHAAGFTNVSPRPFTCLIPCFRIDFSCPDSACQEV